MSRAGIAIATSFLGLAVSSAACSDERPPYTDSVLYTESAFAEGSFAPRAASDTASFAAADSAAVADSLELSGRTTVERLDQPNVAIPLVSGAAGGFAIGVGFAYVGAVIADQSSESSDDLSGLGGAILGFAIGEPLGVALGTHWGNGSRGSFGSDFAMAIASGLIGGGIAAALQAPGVVIGTALQLGATTWVERRTAQQKYETRTGTASP